MPVLYRETVVDQPPTAGGRGIGQQQQLRQQSLLQPQLSTGSSLTGTTIMSPSESIYIYGTPDPRGTQSEDDGTASFGTWMSVSNLGATPAPTRQVPKTQSAAAASAQQQTPSAARKEQPLLSSSQQFPLEVRVPSAGAGGQFGPREAPEGGEVNRRSERWSREEFYPEKGRAPGAPFHKVTKEDYVIEQIVESTPKLVHTTRTVYPAQPQQKQPPGVQQQQLPGVRQQPPGAQQQQPQGVQQQPLGAQQQQPQGAQVQQQQMPRQQYQPVQQHQQVPKQAQQNYQPQQQQQPQHYQPQQQQPQQKYQPPQAQPHQQRQQPPNVPSKPQLPQAAQQPVQPLQQQRQQNVQPVYQTPQSQNYAQQHQYVQQQVQFQQSQKQHELPQHAVQREQYVGQQQSLQQQPQPQEMQVQQQQAQIVQTVQQTEQKKVQQQLQQQKHFQPQQQQVQHVHQKEQRAEGLLQQTAKQEQAVAEEQQNQNKRHQQQHQYVHHQQLDKNAMWEHSQQQQQFEREDTETVSQKKQTLAVQRPTETEQVEDDEPPPQMQLAQAPEELIQQQKPGGEGSFSPERQMHRKHVMVNSPWYRQHPEFQQQQQYQDFRNFAEPLYICSDFQDGSPYPYGDLQQQQQSPHKYYYQHFQPQQRTHQYFSPSSVKWDSVYDDEYPDGYPLPFAHGPGSPYDSLQYHQKVNLDGRRAESEQRRKHHSPVPGAAEHGYMFGGMDFMNHNSFNPYSYVSEPFDERQSRRDLHTGPPRRRGDFYGLDYTTMLPEGQPQQNEWSTEDAQNYHGYQALPPRKNFRLCGHYTADPEAPLNITEANGLDEMDSAYLVGNTLSNQKCAPDRELTDEEKRTFALQYGAGGFKPDHVTMRPEPVPDEPPVFSTTIGPQKSRSAVDISPTPEGYVNPMKVEGENWMLERRSEQGNYGLASSGEQPPFVRPARFPPHVPQWAKQRQFTMTRGAKSVDRSLFAPSWAKVPQPQPPYWVKRSDGGGVGAVQQTMAWTQKQQNKEEQEDGGGVGAVQQTVSWTQKQQNKEEEQDGEQWEQKKVQDQHQQVQAVQGQQQSQQQLRQPVQRQQQIGQRTQQQLQQTQTATLKQQQQQQQQFQPVQQSQHLMQQIPQQQIQQPQDQQQQVGAVQQKPQQQQLYQKEKQPNQTTTTKTTTEQIINQKSPSQQQQDKQAQQWQAVQQATQQKQQPFAQQVKQQQQQQTATTKSETTTTTKTLTAIANGTSKTPKTQWQQQQQRQQPTKQVRVVQQQFEQLPAQQQLFDQPGGMYYFSESRTEGEDGRAGPEGRVVQQQQVPSKDTSGLENLKVPKLGEFPSLPVNGGGKQFNGPAEQQILRNRNAMQQQLRQQHQPRPVQQHQQEQPRSVQQNQQEHPRPVQQQQLQQQPKFPMGRRWSQEPQEGDIFVDGHGRPVQYVREEELDPHTGETVTREEWRLVDEEEEEEEKGERENGNSLPAAANSAQPFFRQQITTKSTKNTSSSSSTKQ